MSRGGRQFQVRFEVAGDGKVRAAFDSVTTTSKQSAESTQALGNELLQLGDRLDESGAQARQHARDVAVLDAALKQGMITTAQYNRMVSDSWDDTIGEKWEELGQRIGTAMKWAGVAVAGGIALVVRNTIQWENALSQLDAAHASTANAVGMTRTELIGLAEDLARTSTFSRAAIVDAETRLLSYSGIVGGNFPRAMQSVIDQSARLGISVEQSAETIGRALESPAKAAAALSDQGFGAAFTEEVRAQIDALVEAGREAEAQVMILEILEESYGGAAQAARDTFGGALVALKNQLMDLMTGDEGSLDGATEGVNNLIEALNDPAVQEGFGKFIGFAATLAGDLADLVGYLGKLPQQLRDNFLPYAERSTQGLVEQHARLQKQLEMQEGSWSSRLGARLGLNDGGAQLRTTIASLEQQIARRQALELGARIGAQYNDDGSRRDSNRTVTVDLTGLDTRTKGEKDAAAKALAEEDRLAKQLQNTYDGLVGRYQQQIALHGETGEAARMRWQIENGELARLEPAQQQVLLRLAEERDAQVEATRNKQDAQRVVDSLKTSQDKLNEALAHYQRLLLAEELTEEQAAAAAERDIRRHDDQMERLRRQNQTQTETMLESWSDLGRGMDYAIASSLDNISAALSRSGTDWRRLGDTIIETFTRVMMNKAIADLIGSLSGSVGGDGSFWGSVIKAFTGARAQGGGVSGRGIYEVTEFGQPELLRQGNRTWLLPGSDGQVIPAQPGHATHQHQAALDGGRVQISVEHRGEPLKVESASAQRGPDGLMVIRMMTRNEVRSMFADGSMDDIMRGFGGARQGVPYG